VLVSTSPLRLGDLSSCGHVKFCLDPARVSGLGVLEWLSSKPTTDEINATTTPFDYSEKFGLGGKSPFSN
jgi:hypothetical protein